MSKLHEALNQQVANMLVMYTKLHNYHWYVKGPQFMELHAGFERLYDAVAGFYDEIAERLLMIGGKPVGTLKESLSLASIKEASGKESTSEMVKGTLADLEQLVKEFHQGIKSAEEADDDVSTDLFVGISAELQKQAWFLRSMTA